MQLEYTYEPAFRNFYLLLRKRIWTGVKQRLPTKIFDYSEYFQSFLWIWAWLTFNLLQKYFLKKFVNVGLIVTKTTSKSIPEHLGFQNVLGESHLELIE